MASCPMYSSFVFDMPTCPYFGLPTTVGKDKHGVVCPAIPALIT